MEKICVGLDGNYFKCWDGGIDFVATVAEALEETGTVKTVLVLEDNSRPVKLLRRIIKHSGNDEWSTGNPRITRGVACCSPNTNRMIYKRTLWKIAGQQEQKKLRYLRRHGIDVLILSVKCQTGTTPIPRIGYIADFQHKYLPELFSKAECEIRDADFRRRIDRCKYLIVNAQDVKKDIQKYYPDAKCEVIVLPFKPFQKPQMHAVPDLEKYNLPERYFVICNQFWMHKSHITAFNALEKLYREGIRDIHIVCTGEMKDDRNPEYIRELKKKIDAMECRDHIHLLGFVPKDDQIQIMKNACGLIQPTLFEGGPGGGSVYNALCLGLACLVSDIPVNREICGYDNVYFFEKQNSAALCELMKEHANDKPVDEKLVDSKISENRREYGEFLLGELNRILAQERKGQ